MDGTILTINTCKKFGKPFLLIALNESNILSEVIDWLNEYEIKKLNIAGPRESSYEGIEKYTEEFLDQLLALKKPLTHI